MSKEKTEIQIKDGQMYLDPIHIMTDESFNVRQHLGNMEVLSEDILENGVRVPLEIQRRDPIDEIECYNLVDGHRRLKAVYMAGALAINRGMEEPDHLKLVPVQFERPDTKPVDRMVSMFVRNTGKPLEPLEEQALFQRMVDMHYKPKEIAKKIGRSLQFVEGRLQLGKASDEVRRAVKDKKITVGAAQAISKKSKTEQDKAVKAIRDTTGSKKAKARDVKAAAGIKSMRTEKEIRIRLKRYRGAKGPYDKGWLAALGWILGEMV